MRHRHDKRAKNLLRRALDEDGTFTPEHEVSPEPQRFDGFFLPAPGRKRRRRDLLDRLAARACGFEVFSAAPRPSALVECIRKLLNARHVLQLTRPCPPLPFLWILCAGRPSAGLATLRARPKRGWPRGVYSTSPVFFTGIVVLTELPETPNTLILRLMGKGPVLRRAVAELERLPAGCRQWRISARILIEYRSEVEQDPSRTREEEDFLMATEFSYEVWERERIDKGRRLGRRQGLREGRQVGVQEGRRKDLLAIYAARFGVVPQKVRAAVERTQDDATLESWVPLFVTRSASEIAAAVRGHRGGPVAA